MPLPQNINAQRDFSAGELDPDLKRRDDLSLTRAGARQMSDWHPLNSGQIEQRPGRRYQFAPAARVDEVEVAPGVIYRLCFNDDGSLVIRDSANVIVLNTGRLYPWAIATIDKIVWTQVKVSLSQTDVVICFPSMRPLIASYNGAAWSVSNFAFSTGADGISATAFYRLAKPGATMTPSAGGAAGTAVNLVMSDDVFLPTHLGGLFRFANSRMQITGVIDTKNASATLLETMNPTQQLTISAPTGAAGTPVFIVGQAVSGSVTNALGVVVATNPNLVVQVLSVQSGFSTSDTLVGPTTSAKITAVANVNPLACAVWDEEIISTARGWPQSCFTDRQRLGFCDLPGAPDAVMWSAQNLPYFFTVGANPTDAMVEVMSGKPHIYHIGAWFDEIVFTSKGVFYIPITSGNVGLKPGSVDFVPLSNEPASSVKPAMTNEGYLYVNAGRTRINAVIGDGAAFSTRPYRVADVTPYHKHLFAGLVKAIAVATGDKALITERYVYVVNADGTFVVGRYQPDQQSGKEWIGWMPWKGLASYGWVSALFSNVMMVTSYSGQNVCETLDDVCYLDAAMAIGTVGSAPLWRTVGSVTLMDGVNNLGTHQIDPVTGAVLPNYPGEVLTSPTLLAGFPFSPTFEPFVANAEPGSDQKQRTRRRRVSRVNISVSNSTGFLFAKLYSGPVGAHLPAAGAVISSRRVPAYNQGDDQSQAPPLREQKYSFRIIGRTYDPRMAVIKDTSGPIRLVEVDMEATI